MRKSSCNSYRKMPQDDRDDELRVVDMIEYLSGLAKLQKEEKTGNIELSRGLQYLAHALRAYAHCRISELGSTLEGTTSSSNLKPISSRNKPELPSQLESIGQEDIERILDDKSYTKQQIVELGVRRFGISRSKLERLRKKDAVESVRAALGHEKSLDVISKVARGGQERLV